MHGPFTYVLDADGHPRLERDTLAWGRWFEGEEGRRQRIVRQDKLDNGVFVSTIFLGIDLGSDHDFLGQGLPVLWESMIFGGPHHQTQWRYASREEAERGHAVLLAMARGGGGDRGRSDLTLPYNGPVFPSPERNNNTMNAPESFAGRVSAEEPLTLAKALRRHILGCPDCIACQVGETLLLAVAELNAFYRAPKAQGGVSEPEVREIPVRLP